MAIPIAAGSILEVRLTTLHDNQLCMNIFHYKVNQLVSDGVGALPGIGAAFETAVWNQIRQGITNEVTNCLILSQWVYPMRTIANTFTPTNTTGAIAQLAMPTGVAIVVKRVSELAGRSHRGRIYVAGMSKDDETESVLSAAWLTAHRVQYETAVTASLTTGPTGLMPPVIWSAKDPLNADPVFTAAVDSILRYQRRREIGVGI